MSRTTIRSLRRSAPLLSALVVACTLFALSGLWGPVAYAQDLPERDTRTWTDSIGGGPSFTFSSLEIRDDCTSRGDILYTSGLRPGWRLQGYVIVRRPDATLNFLQININQATDLNLLVPYPPVANWQFNPGGPNYEVHVDMSIGVYDEENNLVPWIGGDLQNAPGILGPDHQDYDIFCTTPLTPAIDIIKSTNGADANDPDAAGVPLIAPDEPVTWTYLINNPGPVDIPLSEIAVTDNIPGVTPVFAAVVSGDLKGDGNAILQPGEVWRYEATGLALNLASPPQQQGLQLVPNVCRAGDINTPGRTAYTNIGTVQIPNASATDPSSYCNPLTSIQVLKTADPRHEITYKWQITKAVTPAVVNLFEGQSGNVGYSVQVTRTVSAETFAVSGSIYITNTGQLPTTIDTVVDTLSGVANVPVVCPLPLPLTLAVGDSLVCTYDTPTSDGTSRTNLATVTFDNGAQQHTSSVPVVFGPAQEFNTPVTVVDAYNDGPDENLGSGVAGNRTFSYSRSVTCGTDLGYENGVATYTRPNTARIVETEQSADATVTVNCYRPAVEKTVDPAYTRRYTWQIHKSATPTLINLLDGQSAPANYTVTLTKSAPIDENFRVFGTITVNNPHPGAALQLTGISDRLSNGLAAPVTCPSTSVPAGGSLVCTYQSALPGRADGSNSATITATTGLVYRSPVVPYTFTSLNPSQTLLDSVTVTDTNPATGQPWTFSQSGSQQYQLPFACVDIVYNQNGTFTRSLDNTATIVQTGQNSTATVQLTCRLPKATMTARCITDAPVWTAIADTTGAYVVEFITLPVAQSADSSITINLVANTPGTFTYSGAVDQLQSVRLLYNGHVLVTLLGGPPAEEGCVPTSLPPSNEPNYPGASNSIFLPLITGE